MKTMTDEELEHVILALSKHQSERLSTITITEQTSILQTMVLAGILQELREKR